MTILLFTDASTKNGASCWVYKTSLMQECVYDICLTMNTAAMEILAIIKGLESLPFGSEVLVISDFKGAVNIITNYNQDPTWIGSPNNLCHKMARRLKNLLKIYTVDAIWIASRCPNERHLEVDQISKVILQEFLNRGV